eukprot:2855537-Alexandrium_andersonii.AAC.1
MSASLVGSEMCIRDRLCVARARFIRQPDGVHRIMRLSKRTSFKSPESPPSRPSTLQRKLSVITFSAQSKPGS